jgi:hypothetical protein
LALLFCVALFGIASLVLTRRSRQAQAGTHSEINNEGAASRRGLEQSDPGTSPSDRPRQLPFIVADTATDSPGTNLETRVVTFTAEVSGAPPLFRQWKVNKGSGFAAVSTSATNSVLMIANAQVTDTGLYSLFTTNRFGGTNTTPVPLVVVVGAD